MARSTHPWLDAELVGQRVATARLRPDGTLNSPLAHHHEPGPASPRDPPAPFSACSFRTDDGPVPETQSRDDHTVEDDDLTVDVGVQLGDRCRRPRRQTSLTAPATAPSPNRWPRRHAKLPNRICDRVTRLGRGTRRRRRSKVREPPAPGHPLRAATGPGCWPNLVRAARPIRERTRARSPSDTIRNTELRVAFTA